MRECEKCGEPLPDFGSGLHECVGRVPEGPLAADPESKAAITSWLDDRFRITARVRADVKRWLRRGGFHADRP